MKVRNLVSKRFKETPADCAIASQALMMRGGYIKPVGNGIFTLFPITKRITAKIENIIREEMNRIDGQEVLFPVTMPADLWRKSGRFDSIGSELLRFKDRSGADMVLGMTHEEASVQLMTDVADSYTQYPFMIYQIQTKFRDEPRCRGGLIRVREFTMKDAYSFHTSQEDLEAYYARAYEAYNRVYARCGVPEVVAVASDSGMMGGKVSHEYMLLTDVGEDTIVLCRDCDYRANMEAAPCLLTNEPGEAAPLEKVPTPDCKTIEDLCALLKIKPQQTCKAVMYQRNADDSFVIVFIRGDLDVNETKLRNFLKAEVHPAVVTEDSGIHAGFTGPIGLPEGVTVVYDNSLKGIEWFATGACEDDAHYVGFNIARDVGNVEYVDVAKAFDGGICPVCGKPHIYTSRGIEVGNIFQLGTKYTESMDMTYVDQDGSHRRGPARRLRVRGAPRRLRPHLADEHRALARTDLLAARRPAGSGRGQPEAVRRADRPRHRGAVGRAQRLRRRDVLRCRPVRRAAARGRQPQGPEKRHHRDRRPRQEHEGDRARRPGRGIRLQLRSGRAGKAGVQTLRVKSEEFRVQS